MKRERGQEGMKDGKNQREISLSPGSASAQPLNLSWFSRSVCGGRGEDREGCLALPSCKALFRLTVLSSCFQLTLGRNVMAPGLRSV